MKRVAKRAVLCLMLLFWVAVLAVDVSGSAHYYSSTVHSLNIVIDALMLLIGAILCSAYWK